MKKIAMLLVIAMLLALLGCAKEKPAEKTPEPPAPEETAVTVQEEPEAEPKPEIKPTAVREPEAVTPKVPAAEPEKSAEKKQTTPAEKPKAEPVKPQSDSQVKLQTTAPQQPAPKEETLSPEPTSEPEPKPEPEPEPEPEPQPVIDSGALASAGRSYASSLGFTVDTSLNLGNASYFPGDRIRLDSMNSGYSIVCSDVQVTYDSLMYADGSIDGTRLNVLVTDDGGGIYTVWVLYG